MGKGTDAKISEKVHYQKTYEGTRVYPCYIRITVTALVLKQIRAGTGQS